MPAEGQSTPKRHPNAKMSWEQVTEMRRRWWGNETTMGALAKEYHLSQSTVYHILMYETYKKYKPNYGEPDDTGRVPTGSD